MTQAEGYHFNYLLDDTDSEQEDELDITQYLVDSSTAASNYHYHPEDYCIKCTFCSSYGHTLSHCIQAKSIGQNLHLKGIEVRKNDLALCSLGNGVKEWVEKLTFMQIIVLSNRINLRAYAYTLWERGMTETDRSLFNTREDYNICLRFFYYFEPTGNYLKHRFHFVVEVVDTNCDATNNNSITTFECPICIENSLPIKEMVRLSCSHCICNDCFCNYLNHMSNSNNSDKSLKKPFCSLCRSVISKADFTSVDYLNDINKKYIFKK